MGRGQRAVGDFARGGGAFFQDRFHQSRLLGQLRAARLSPGLLREHGLLARYVPSHPLLFVYEDAEGVTGFKCRKPSLREKSVLNALGFGGTVEGRSLFGVSLAREAIARYGRAIVVEGEFDALGWHAASLAVGRHFELVALGGAAKPTVEKFRTLRSLGACAVYLALDADPAGEAAAVAACHCAWEAGLEVGVLSMPEGCKDPDDVLAQQGPVAGAASLFTLDRAGHKPDELTAAAAEYLLRRDAGLDFWRPVSKRPPTEASPFTTTSMAVRALKTWSTPEQKERVEKKIAAVRARRVSMSI